LKPGIWAFGSSAPSAGSGISELGPGPQFRDRGVSSWGFGHLEAPSPRCGDFEVPSSGFGELRAQAFGILQAPSPRFRDFGSPGSAIWGFPKLSVFGDVEVRESGIDGFGSPIQGFGSSEPGIWAFGRVKPDPGPTWPDLGIWELRVLLGSF